MVSQIAGHNFKLQFFPASGRATTRSHPHKACPAPATSFDPAFVNPAAEVLALTHVEDFEVVAAFDDCFDAETCHPHAAAHGKLAKLKQM